MIAVAVIIGVGVMVGSFRMTLERWLEHTLAADLYVSPAAERGGTLRVSPPQVEALASLSGASRIQTIRRVELAAPAGPTTLLVLGGQLRDASAYRFRDTDGETAWAALRAGGVWVSEPYAERHGVGIGDRVVLPTDTELRTYEIGATYYSYASDRGAILMARDTYAGAWRDDEINGVAVYAEPGAALLELGDAVRAALISEQAVTVVSNRELREQSLVVFDRTFLITDVLRVLVMLVAFVGVLSALMAQQLERAREFAVLRATGMTPRQLRVLVTAQTGVLGAIAGFLAIPLGLYLAWVMIAVINKRSFGWSLQMTVPTEVLLQAVGLAVLAALLAGILPGRRMAATPPAISLREE
jgi:putative ABC transport system permease protein